MGAHPRADEVHGFPLEQRAPEPDARNVYWPLTMDTATPVTTFTGPTAAILARADTTTTTGNGGSSTCAPDNNSGICEKSATASSLSLPIALGVVIPLVGIICAMLILHRRHVRKQREEDANDRHASLDFGLGGGGQSKWKKQKNGGQQMSSDFNLEEKSERRGKGMSLDINSPYILPPGLNNSHDSLHSLSRSLTNKEDPYRPVTALGDSGSIRSFGGRKHDGSSIYTGHSTASTRFQENPVAGLVENASAMGRTPAPAFMPPPRQGSLPQYSSHPSSPVEPHSNDPARDISPIEPAYFPGGTSSDKGVPPNGLPSNPKDGSSLSPGAAQEPRESYMGQDNAALRMSNNYLGSYISGGARSDTPPSSALPKDTQSSPFPDSAGVLQMPEEPNHPEQAPTVRNSPPIANSLPANPRPQRQASLPQNQPTGPLPEIPQISQPQTWVEDDYDNNDGFFVTPPSPTSRNAEIKASNRYSMDVPPEEYAKAGLGAPGVDPRRISMGFRPLPPTLAVESDDPEIRANRIRSFYKEYFDDSKPAPQGQYYEDYDDGAYHDPQGNNFTMPYAQPMARRAMTPPPGAGRFMGQHPPRAFHGSLAQNNYGPPRNRNFNGSVSSSTYQGPPGFGEPRPFSSASNRRGPPPPRGRPVPPPQDLSTIPTPALLKDDSFSILNAIDFAPPTSYKERAQGRSQSPMGERKAYQMNVPAHRPLVSAFDELAPMPSPHMLRKSGTFTSLDFAPPRKVFRDNDTMSDAGSIRSNRSGISTMQLQAIRGGAHRVSRLPGDQVFSKDEMSNVLKPTWGQRK